MKNALFLSVGLLVASGFVSSSVSATEFKSPDIVVLGDSQLSFGSGPTFLNFFENLQNSCGRNDKERALLHSFAKPTVGIMGVRSTSLPSWVARKGPLKGAVCNVDKKWRVNAAVFGVSKKTDANYVQIGQGKPFQFCKKGLSPFEAMFDAQYYKPKLLVLNFLGNSSKTWSRSYKNALRDVTKTMKQVPSNIPCVFVATVPVYKKKINRERLKAQNNLKKAFEKSGIKCSFVEGFTPKTIAAIQGQKTYFRRKKSGAVKDPFHPNKRAAKLFFKHRKGQICEAVLKQVGRYQAAQKAALGENSTESSAKLESQTQRLHQTVKEGVE